MIWQCLLDMDGVLADFVGGAVAAHGKHNPYDRPNSHGVFDMEKLWDITPAQFWKPCESLEFWTDLEKTPDAEGLVATCEAVFGESHIAILTAPSDSPACVPGKKAWIKRHFPQYAKKIIFGSHKEFLAAPNRVLIDDRDKNVTAFSVAGGSGILMPRLWNADWELADESLGHVAVRLDRILSGCHCLAE